MIFKEEEVKYPHKDHNEMMKRTDSQIEREKEAWKEQIRRIIDISHTIARHQIRMHNFTEYYYVRHYNTYYYWHWSHDHNYNYNNYGPLSIEDT